MTVSVLARFHCATETIEAVDYDRHVGGGYHYGVRFYGGSHANAVIRCHTESSVIQLFDQAVTARKNNAPLWWLNGA